MLVKHSVRTLRKACRCHGRTDLWWAHDTDIPVDEDKRPVSESGKPEHICAGAKTDGSDPCNVSGKFTLIEKDGTRHDTSNNSNNGTRTPNPVPDTPKFEFKGDEAVTPAATAAPAPADDKLSAVSALLELLAPKVDESQVRAIVAEAVSQIVHPTRTVVVNAETEERVTPDGLTHAKLADVIVLLDAGEHVLMVGPAGTGKSTIAEQSAESLALEYGSISLSPQTPASAILGYMQAAGEYVRTVFRERFEHGGVFHFDEFDNGHPSILAVVNAALANGQMAFPDGMVKRHRDFRCVASANTYGRGPDRQYVGRQQIDAATLDRFAVETIEIDESLETSLCMSIGYDADKTERVLSYVRSLRTAADEHKMMLIFSPRASVGMVKQLNKGRTVQAVVDSRIRRGISDQDWSKVSQGIMNCG